MVPEPERQQNLAVLIDADNTSPSVIENLFAEIAKYGIASVKRIYGDWTSPYLKGWKEVLLTYAIHPIQQFHYTVGKNATDSAMIIDAMDLLYSNRFNGFCLVSSDSDFTRLATRIREGGITVYGFGKKNTPNAFVSACDKFIYTEILEKESAEDGSEHTAGEDLAAKKKQAPKMLRGDTKLANLLRNSVDAVADEDGWAALGNVGQHISNQSPSFDSRNYGFRKLSSLVKATGLFEMESRAVGGESGNRAIFIRHKQRKGKKPGK
ncbi:MAG TPA: NYN domain-containing protein [Synergistales bacterium]|nr:NYN domain-containing protein [Synergistales bacterium]MDI9393394.1 NYN domain-containing protein [Synergistota bacterium]NLV64414.1 NYN domain-containing protein [Synergistaceae bacterium]HRW87626.1 NYN domain-containing protein [Thermovirgaceae bacterium]MDD3830367.1 NYN domain-containing protein [Synergistales bacterium]